MKKSPHKFTFTSIHIENISTWACFLLTNTGTLLLIPPQVPGASLSHTHTFTSVLIEHQVTLTLSDRAVTTTSLLIEDKTSTTVLLLTFTFTGVIVESFIFSTFGGLTVTFTVLFIKPEVFRTLFNGTNTVTLFLIKFEISWTILLTTLAFTSIVWEPVVWWTILLRFFTHTHTHAIIKDLTFRTFLFLTDTVTSFHVEVLVPWAAFLLFAYAFASVLVEPEVLGAFGWFHLTHAFACGRVQPMVFRTFLLLALAGAAFFVPDLGFIAFYSFKTFTFTVLAILNFPFSTILGFTATGTVRIIIPDISRSFTFTILNTFTFTCVLIVVCSSRAGEATFILS